MSKRNLQQRIADEIKRRKRRPHPAAISLGPVSRSLYHELTTKDQALLYSIEQAIVAAWNENPEIDDKAVSIAIQQAILESECSDPASALVLKALLSGREHYEFQAGRTFDPELYRNGWRVALESLRLHRDVAGGDRAYLEFIGGFIA